MNLSRLFLSADERRLRTGWRLLLQIILFFVFSLVLIVPAGLFLAFLPLRGTLPIPGLEQLASVAGFSLGMAVQVLAALLSVIVARRFLDRRSLVSLGLDRDRRAITDLLFGVALAGVMIGLIFLIEWLAGWLRFEGFAWEVDTPGQVVSGTLLMLVVFLFVGFYEELVFRGYWLRNLMEGLSLPWGVTLSSLAFALIHLPNPGASRMAMLGLALVGVLFAFCVLRTGRLWLPVGLHIGLNLFEGTVFGFQVSGLEDQIYRLIRQSVEGPDLWTGGAFGPEAGLVLIPSLALGFLGVHLYTRRAISHIAPDSDPDSVSLS